jgi:putative hydrolase of the HAD superfamily
MGGTGRTSPRGVIFDLGGVVLGSPMHAIAEYEREAGLPAGLVNRHIVERGPEGAWARLERGELATEAFFAAFDAEFARAGHAMCARTMMTRMGEATQPRPAMVDAIARIRAAGLRAAALTNNWRGEGEGTSQLEPHFDVFVESAVLGIRKPDPRIYAHVLEALELRAAEAVFLDDIGRNLKPAREMGMHTIKVDDPDAALAELEDLLGLALR